MRLPALLCLLLLLVPALPAVADDADRLGSLLDGDAPAATRSTSTPPPKGGKASKGKATREKAVSPKAGARDTTGAPGAFGALFDESGHSTAPPPSVDAMLGDAADKPLLDERLGAARERHRIKAEVSCANRIRDIKACLGKRGCTPLSDADQLKCQQKQCGARPSQTTCVRHHNWCAGYTEEESNKWHEENPGANMICLTGLACAEYVDNPAWRTWQDCANSAVTCQTDAACLAPCNPQGETTLGDCTAREAARNAPTRADARAELERDRRDAARAGTGKDRLRQQLGLQREPDGTGKAGAGSSGDNDASAPRLLLADEPPAPAGDKEVSVEEVEYHGGDLDSAALGCERAEKNASSWRNNPYAVDLISQNPCTCRELRETFNQRHQFFCTVTQVLRFERPVQRERGEGGSASK